ncbi:TonB-dependent hemoglobin/transferrin/lactoferrin family receptor [Kinneretia aquatilis]|uniref:TonB-dependent hemoglobin/transferrin/lactoferrin family receptor n=1 Tax=Kinneretia aquatilis TaxID=2070761 RepID=UPI001495286A|nr:TonB-dependent hemoglobin/transferrin/lactoferrin family receptor [Paucibacter aquatile]WIV99029.1 TonB-dependent hemoglobin/transferrin/lactoferrin family receptor [Paucibacter aquatile]
MLRTHAAASISSRPFFSGAEVNHYPSTLRPIALAVALMATPGLGLAQSGSPKPDQAAQPAAVTALPEITISATRTERASDKVPNTVTVIDRAALLKREARNLKDLLDGEVDLAVRSAATRFSAAGSSLGRAGNEGLNIRGLEGNQVLMMVDGIRLPQAFSFGAFASGRADQVDLDALSRAEVLRGPASAQFGSDGLAGALSLNSLSPEDLLKDGKTQAGLLRSSLATVDRSQRLSGAYAFQQGEWQHLLQLSLARGHETQNRGERKDLNSLRTAPNPADIRSESLLAKTALRLSPSQRLQATLEWRQRRQDTDVLSGRAPVVNDKTPTAVIDLDAQDRLNRRRVSLEHRYDDLNGEWLQSLHSQIYVQHSETRQRSVEDRHQSPDRIREGFYREQLIGFSSQAQTQLSGQRLSYGIDLSRNRISGLRDGTVPPAGESFPSKPFPDTDASQVGAFVQSEIETGSLSLIPGLRYERYRLSPKSTGYSGAVVSLSDQALTPRLGLVWRASETVQPYAQWALGFRAPTADQVNNGFANPVHGYESIGNPDLKAERAQSLELGLRGRVAEQLRWQLSAYRNRYRDFISQQVVRGSGKPKDPLIFQSINLNQARIQGVEARVFWQAQPGLELSAALARSRGHSEQNGERSPLDTVQPDRAQLGARWERGDWSWSANWQLAAAKRAQDSSVASQFLTPRYQVLDLGLGWRVQPGWRLQAQLNNVGNSRYWRWADVRGLAANNTELDAYTAPGRQLQVSLAAEF